MVLLSSRDRGKSQSPEHRVLKTRILLPFPFSLSLFFLSSSLSLAEVPTRLFSDAQKKAARLSLYIVAVVERIGIGGEPVYRIPPRRSWRSRVVR